MTRLKKYLSTKKHLLAVVLIATVMGVSHFFIPLVYGLNDDTMLRSILSGSYLGTPDGHAIYMKYPLTGILSTLYRITDAVPWLTLFFTVCIAACLYLILHTIRITYQRKSLQILCISLAVALFLLLFFGQFIIMHYTLVAALIVGTAIFLVISAKTSSRSCYGISLLLLFLGYMIRSQVFFLSLPFMAIALMWGLADSPKSSHEPSAKGETLRQKFRSLLQYLGIWALGILILVLTHKVMYSHQSWQEFESYNDARTRVYDYTNLLPYDEYTEIYQNIGITKEQYTMLTEYATALDNSITAKQLNQLADEAEKIINSQITTKDLFIKRFQEYRHRTFNGQDAPYNAVVIIAYVAVAVLCLMYRQWYRLLLLAMLGGGRSLIWMFLMMRGRYPERVTISLYLIETLLLAGMLLHLTGKKTQKETKIAKPFPIAMILLVISILVCIPFVAKEIKTAYNEAVLQKEVQQEWAEVLSYMQENDDSFFYIDVYSTVSISGMQYDAAEYENYLLLGGWTTQSALFEKKQTSLGFATPAEALASGKPFYLIMDTDRSVLWLEKYLSSIGYPITFTLYEEIGTFGIYTTN